MQIHGPSATVGAIIARLNTVREPFAVIDLGGMTIHVESVADADELIKAAVKAKELLLGETSKSVPAADPGPRLIGRLVEDLHDDSDCPQVGKIVGQIDEETVEVLWDGEQHGRREFLDGLRPARENVSVAADPQFAQDPGLNAILKSSRLPGRGAA